MSRTRITDLLDTVVDEALRARALLPEANRILLQRLPVAPAANYDTDRPGAVAWCDHHERTIGACRKAYLEGRSDRLCRGVPLPKVTDPTGDAAAADDIFSGIREVAKRAQLMAQYAEWIRAWVQRQIIDDAMPEESDYLAELNDSPKCQHHLRFGYLVDAMGKRPTRVTYKNQPILSGEYLLCRWCTDNVRERFTTTAERRLPAEHEVHRADRKAMWAKVVT